MITKKVFASRFSTEEWQLLCSRVEFLDVIVAEPFDPELAAVVAYRILLEAPRVDGGGKGLPREGDARHGAAD
jgi:hypothetical protein